MKPQLTFDDIAKRFTNTPTYRTTVPWKYLEETIVRWETEKGTATLDLNPDFQRNHVWTPEQQRLYVEYALSGGMSGRDIYFNCNGWMKGFQGPFVIVDGKQRLEAVRQFMANKVAVFGGYYLNEIEGHLSHVASQFTFHVNDLKSRAEVIKWYLEMNTGGTPHTNEEIEKAKKLLDDCQTI